MKGNGEREINTNEKNPIHYSMTDQLYQNMSLFTDTILFEYSYIDKKLYLSNNAEGQFDVSAFQCFFEKEKEAAPKKGEIRSVEVSLGKKGGPYHWCSCKLMSLWEDPMAGPVKLIGKLQDITEVKAREMQLLRQSIKDGLTGVYNKMAFEYRIKEKLKKGSGGWLCMIDIDNFKEINDSFGHPTGDRILTQVGRILCDIYKKPDLVGRVGGDEFVIFTSNENAKERAEKLLRRVGKIALKEAFSISASIGIVSNIQKSGGDYQNLFLKADRAMYHAKQSGKNRIAFFDEAFMD